jgi:hypothetical protein
LDLSGLGLSGVTSGWELILTAGAADAFYSDRRQARFHGDSSVLLGDKSAGGTIALCATQHCTRDPTIGPLRAILINDIEQHEFRTSTRSGFSGHLE